MGLFSTAAKLSRIANKIDTPVSTSLFTRPEKLNNIEVENKQVSNTEFDTRIEGLDEATTATDWQKKTKKFVSESRDVNPTVRTPELENSTMDLIAGKITREQHLNNVDEYKPVNPWDALPREPSSKATVFSLKPNQREDGFFVLSTEDAKSLGVTKSLLAIGQRFLGRLDIPAYKDYDTWIVAGKSPKGEKGTVYAKAIHYGSEDGKPVVFRASQGKSEKIGKGKADPDYTPETHEKTGYATVDGIVQDLDVRAIRAKAAKYLNDPEWTQVGFDPRRQGGFYVRAGDSKHVPIREASEVIQIGPLVLAKNAKLDFEHVGYAEGGAVSVPNEKVGTKTGKSTQAGRDVYTTEDGENVSEKSTTFKYKGQWINVPSIHNGYQYDNDTLSMMLDAEVIAPTSTHKSESDAVKAAVERSKSIAANFNKGGTPMQRQMELFRDGGLKDEGGMIDEVSGNEVPIGGTKEGVRDDIPANVSEGEFVMPADVVRYHGLDKMMQIRQDAKMGLKRMEAMGQMGNSDEATMDDDMPFGMADLIIVGDNDEPMEFADGGFVPSKNYAPGGLTTSATGSGRVGQPVDVEPTAPVIPVDQPATRRLTPEVATAPAAKIDFKKLMGEAAIEYKEYRNAAGESMMISFIGGEPAYPIPDGYTLYTGDGAVGSGTVGGTADGIAYAANTATAEYRQSNNDNDDPFKDTPVAKAIDWASLSTEELMAESAKLTGVSSTIAKGAMAFMGPFGAIGYAMMRHQDKKVAQEIANRIAKGGLTATQLKTLTAAQEKLTPKGFTLIGKIIETVGTALGFGKDVVEVTKKNAVSIESNTASRSPALSGDRLIAAMKEEFEGELTAPINSTTTANMARDFAKEGTDYAALQDRQAKRYREMIAFGPGPLPDGQTREGIESSIIESIGEDGFREIQSNLRSDYMRINEGGNLGSTGTIVRPGGTLDGYEEKKYGLSAPGSKLTSEESIAKRKDAASAYTPPSYAPAPSPTTIDGPFAGFPSAPTPTALPVDPRLSISSTGFPAASVPTSVATQTENAFTPSTPSYDMFGKPHANATVRKYADDALEDSSAFANTVTKVNNLIKGYDFKTDLGPLPGVDPNFTLESAPMIKSESSPYVVPPSPVLNIDNRPSGDSRDYQGGSYGYGQTGVAPFATAPKSDVPSSPRNSTDTAYDYGQTGVAPLVAEQTQQAFNAPAYTGQGSFSFQPPAPVAAAPVSPTFPVDPRLSISSTGLPAAKAQTFNEEFAAQRKAGAKEFSYDRDGDGKTERYTTQTAEEVAPKGSNSIFQSAANLFTPGDGKEYIDGKLVTTKKDSGTSKAKAKAPSTKVKDQVATGSGNKITVVTKPSSNKTEGAVSSGGQYAGDGFEWVSKKNADGTPALNENGGKQLTRTYTGVNENTTGSNNTSSASSSSSDKSIVCTEMYRQTQLADWQQAMKIWHVYQEKHLTMYHQVGYHWLFQPYVKGMKNSSILTKLGSKLAKHRTQHLRHVLTKGKAKDDILGNVWCKFIHPLVYVSGVIKEKIGK